MVSEPERIVLIKADPKIIDAMVGAATAVSALSFSKLGFGALPEK